MYDFEDVLIFVKDLFFCNDYNNFFVFDYWLKNWREIEKFLKEFDYKGLKEYFICFYESYLCYWDLMDLLMFICKYCGRYGFIKYYYFGLSEKIWIWFFDVNMCRKMFVYWMNRDYWISGIGLNLELKEVWGGSCFSELFWFWDLILKWMLLCRCKCCGIVMGEKEIRVFFERDGMYIL